ncbi:helicase [Dorcoceras hygrometricum]|uniref:Helicase n=1 Tax=Dorcoceras hygrometricum TaxID=472368 RepID=A0A2Z6ZYP0_9LAMI|nr:helicase [Dorcoceras hygrometricum]
MRRRFIEAIVNAMQRRLAISALMLLLAIVDKISLEQVQSRFHVDELKAALSQRISNLDTAFLTASDNQDRVTLVQIDILRKEKNDQKAARSKELDGIHKEVQDQKLDLIDFRQETQTGIAHLSSELSEIIAYINRGRDAKNGEMESSSQGP